MSSGKGSESFKKAWSFRKTRLLPGINLITFYFTLLTVTVERIVCEKSMPEFDDKHAFEISWLGSDTKISALGSLQHHESIIMNTKEKESYRCFLPNLRKSDEDKNESADGPKAEDLLAGILTLKGTKCSYRLEPFWTYEVCHGLHVRQFHEEKVPGQEKPKVQEYYLGKVFTDDPGEEESKDGVPEKHQPKTESKIPRKEIDGRMTPYFNFTMDNGTPCDIKHNKPRRVDILYICHATANNEVFSVKETTTCEYEVIILTPELCHNPAYVIKDNPVNGIQCLPLEGAPSQPSKLAHLQENALEEKVLAETKHTWILEPTAQAENNKNSNVKEKPNVDNESPVKQSNKVTTTDDQLTREFLSGDYCLHGGSGWWLYEFCYGKHVQQFHQEPSGKTIIYLGYWDKQKHLEWIKTKKNFASKKHVTHFYTNGDICDLTGKPRTAQVKLKCLKDTSGQQISIYMVEPKPCEYIVGIESPILCPFIETADAQGLFKNDILKKDG